jgi:hypothetical protein
MILLIVSLDVVAVASWIHSYQKIFYDLLNVNMVVVYTIGKLNMNS